MPSRALSPMPPSPEVSASLGNVPTLRVQGFREASGRTEYKVATWHRQGDPAVVWLRYSDVLRYHLTSRPRHAFPVPKRLIHTQRVKEERRQALEQYLRSVVAECSGRSLTLGDPALRSLLLGSSAVSAAASPSAPVAGAASTSSPATTPIGISSPTDAAAPAPSRATTPIHVASPTATTVRFAPIPIVEVAPPVEAWRASVWLDGQPGVSAAIAAALLPTQLQDELAFLREIPGDEESLCVRLLRGGVIEKLAACLAGSLKELQTAQQSAELYSSA